MTQPINPQTALDAAIAKILTINVSPMFSAILDYVFEHPEPRAMPQITAMTITSDGFLMAWNTNRPDKEGLLGNVADLDQNLRGICSACKFDPELTARIITKAYSRIPDWRSGRDRRGANPYASQAASEAVDGQ